MPGLTIFSGMQPLMMIIAVVQGSLSFHCCVDV